jgi:hypothetical protein
MNKQEPWQNPMGATPLGYDRTAELHGPIYRLAHVALRTLACLCAWGLITSWAISQGEHQAMWSGVKDFSVFYGGAKMLGSGVSIYDYSALHAIIRNAVGSDSDGYHYVRLPIVALAYKPFAVLPYGPALILWRVLTVLGFLSIAWILPVPRRLTLLAVAVSLGAYNALLVGQDTWLLVLMLAFFNRFMSEDHDIPSGVLLGAAVVLKFHLFPLALVALALQRKWRLLLAAAGVIVGCLAISFAIEPSWPTTLLRSINETGKPSHMPNLGGFLSAIHVGHQVYPLFLLAALAAVGSIALQSGPVFAFGIAILAGVLVSLHGYAYDYALLIPALLPIAWEFPQLGRHCIFWLMPFPLVLIVSKSLPITSHLLLFAAGGFTLYCVAEDLRCST